MLANFFKRRSSLLLFFILFFLSAPCSANSWLFNKIQTSNSSYSCAKIYYPIDNQITGLELSFVKGSYGLRATVAVKCHQIPDYQGIENQAVVTYIVDDAQKTVLANRMQGGQELLLPQEVTSELLCFLLQGEPIIIYLNGYEACIPSENFACVWKKLENLKVRPSCSNGLLMGEI